MLLLLLLLMMMMMAEPGLTGRWVFRTQTIEPAVVVSRLIDTDDVRYCTAAVPDHNPPWRIGLLSPHCRRNPTGMR